MDDTDDDQHTIDSARVWELLEMFRQELNHATILKRPAEIGNDWLEEFEELLAKKFPRKK